MTACLCAAGGERPPRREQAERLHARILAGERFTATLVGARISAGEDVDISREAGEARRGGLRAMALPVGVPVVWDGRFAAVAHRPGLWIRPLGGVSRTLPEAERRRLKSFPAEARAALPVIVLDVDLVTCPMLAWGAQASLRGLVRGRLDAACGGLVVREAQLASASDGEPVTGALS
jgi:tRNA(Ile)-lysidine synthase